MDSQISNSLEALLAARTPVRPSKLLALMGPFLLVLSKQSGSSETVQTIHYLMREWYVNQVKTTDDDLSIYPTLSSPGVCYNCFHVFGGGNGCLRMSCNYCRADPTKQKLWIFQDMLSYRYSIHPAWIEWCFCNAIYDKSMRSNCVRYPTRDRYQIKTAIVQFNSNSSHLPPEIPAV